MAGKQGGLMESGGKQGRQPNGPDDLADLLHGKVRVDDWRDLVPSGKADLGAWCIGLLGLDIAPGMVLRVALAMAGMPALSGAAEHRILQDYTSRTQVRSMITVIAGLVRDSGPWSDVVTPLPSGQAVIDLTSNDRQETLVLRAGITERLILRGPRDAVFEDAALVLSGRSLQRNLADPFWRAERSDQSNTSDHLFAQPARITGIGLRSDQDVGDELAEIFSAGLLPILIDLAIAKLLRGSLSAAIGTPPHFTDLDGNAGPGDIIPVAADTMAVRCTLSAIATQSANLLIRSPSHAQSVGITIGDDTVQQVIQPLLTADAEATTRDFTDLLNERWAIAADTQPGETIDLPLGFLSPSDGRIAVALIGSWRHERRSTHQLDLAAGDQISLPVPAPWWGDSGSTVTITSSGRLDGGPRVALQPTASTGLRIHLDEHLQIACTCRLADDRSGTPSAETIATISCFLPAVPSQAWQAQLRLAVAGEDFTPADEVLLETIDFPADAAAYRSDANSGGYWYDHQVGNAVSIDGTTRARPLLCILSGVGNGGDLLLCPCPLSDAIGTSSPWRYRKPALQARWRSYRLRDEPVGLPLVFAYAAASHHQPVSIAGSATIIDGDRWRDQVITCDATGCPDGQIRITAASPASIELTLIATRPG